MHSSYESEPVGIERQGLPNGCPAQERFHHRLIQCVPNVILFLSLDHLILEFNPEAERLYGRKREDVLGKDYFEEFLPEEARHTVAADIEKVLAGEPTRNFQNAIIAHDSREHILSWNVDRVLDSDNNPIGIIAVGQDITDGEKAEKTLEQYELMVESAHDAIFFKDRLSRYVIANDKTLESFGLSREQVIGKSDYEIMADKEQARQNIENDQVVFETGKLKEYVKEMASVNGAKLLFQTIKVSLFSENRDVIGLIGIARDITEHKRIDEALRISEQQYRTTLNSMQDAIHVVDAGLTVVLINERFLQWLEELGIEIHDPIGRSIPEIFPFLPDKVCDEYRHVFEYGDILTTEDTIKVADRHITTNTRKIPVYKENKIVQVVTIIRDITENKRAEEALRESEEKYRTLFESANDAIFALQVDGSNLSFKECNSHTMEMFKCRREDIIGKSPVDFSPSVQPDGTISKERAAELCAAAVAGVPQRFEWKHCRLDGAEFDAEVTLNCVDIAGEICLQAIIRDISERKQSEEALHESENRYRSVVENAREGIAVVQDGILKFVNPYLVNAMGYSENEHLSRPFIEFVHQDDRKLVMEIYMKRFKGEEIPLVYEFRTVDKQGNTKWLENNGIMIEWDGKPATLNFLRDITGRKMAEESLRQSQERLKILFESAPDAYYIHDLEGNFIDGNKAAEELVGYAKEEAIGKSMFELGMITEADVPKVIAAIAANREGKPAGPQELLLNHKNGSKVMVEIRSYPVDIAGETLILGIARDITERKKAEAALAESELKFRKFFENEPEYCYMISPEGTILEANYAALNTLGYTMEELAGKPVASIYAPESYSRMHQLLTQWENTGKIRDEEMVILTKNGEKRTVLLSATQVLHDDGKPLYSVSIQRDITGRKRAEEANRISVRHFEDLFNKAAIPLCLVSKELSKLNINTQFEKTFGYSQEEVPTLNEWWQLAYPDPIYRKWVIDTCDAALQQAVKAKTDIKPNEYRVTCKDGDIRTMVVFGSFIEYDLLLTFFDITEHKRNNEINSARLHLLQFAATHSMDELLEETLNEAEKLTDSLIGFYHFVEDDQTSLTLQSWSTRTKVKFCKAGGEGLHYPVDEAGVWVDCVHQRKPVIHNDYASLPHRKGMPEGHVEVVRELVVPVFRGDKIKAILGVGNKPVDYMEKDMVTISLLADLAWEIAERKNAEEALKISEQHYRAIVEDQTELICRFLPDSTITFANEAYCRYFDKSCDELIGQKFIPHIPEEDYERVNEYFTSLGPDKPVETHEHRVIMTNGEIRWHQWITRAIFDDVGNIVELQGSGRDITKQKMAEEELRENERRFRSISEAAFEGIAITEKGMIVDVNNALLRMYGYSDEELKGKQAMELVAPEYRELVLEKIRSVYDGLYEHKGIRKDGSLIDLEVQGCNIEYQGRTMRLTAIRDVTERKQAERRIQEYQAQLKSLASELSLAEERERRRIATGIHDNIAQKLAMAKFSLQTLQASIRDADVSMSLKKQCELMNQVVTDARSLTFELGNPVLYQVGLEAAVESYLTERIQKELGIECKFKSEGPKSSLKEDVRIVLFQAVRELLANVIKHANASTIKVSVKNAEKNLQIVVEDNGVGFDPTKIGPQAIGQGGFGLFNIRERLEYFGGNFEIESRANSGTRVTMTVALRANIVTKKMENVP
jgi:PAS domain S-box-containing protein